MYQFKRGYSYGFKSFQLTIDEYLCGPDEIDWHTTLETHEGDKVVFVENNQIKIDLMARTIIWQQKEIEKLQARLRAEPGAEPSEDDVSYCDWCSGEIKQADEKHWRDEKIPGQESSVLYCSQKCIDNYNDAH